MRIDGYSTMMMEHPMEKEPARDTYQRKVLVPLGLTTQGHQDANIKSSIVFTCVCCMRNLVLKIYNSLPTQHWSLQITNSFKQHSHFPKLKKHLWPLKFSYIRTNTVWIFVWAINSIASPTLAARFRGDPSAPAHSRATAAARPRSGRRRAPGRWAFPSNSRPKMPWNAKGCYAMVLRELLGKTSLLPEVKVLRAVCKHSVCKRPRSPGAARRCPSASSGTSINCDQCHEVQTWWEILCSKIQRHHLRPTLKDENKTCHLRYVLLPHALQATLKTKYSN